MRPLDAARQHRRGIGFNGDHLHRRLPGLEDLADAGDRAAGADAGDEDVDLPIGIAPDLLGGCAAMDGRIGRILELLRDEIAGIGRRHLLGTADGATHAVRPGRQYQFGAVGLEQQATFAAHGFRHHEAALDAARGTDHRQANAGVA
jgi:hypothetical protein